MSSLCNKYKSTTLFNFPNNFPLFSSNVNFLDTKGMLEIVLKNGSTIYYEIHLLQLNTDEP